MTKVFFSSILKKEILFWGSRRNKCFLISLFLLSAAHLSLDYKKQIAHELSLKETSSKKDTIVSHENRSNSDSAIKKFARIPIL